MIDISAYPDLLAAAREIAREAIRHTSISQQKLARMEDLYLSRTEVEYDEQHAGFIRKAGAAMRYKFLLATMHLEELWSLSEACRWEIATLLEPNTMAHCWSDAEHALGMMQLEAFLFQARAFIDVYTHYASLVMKVRRPGNMSVKTFRRYLQRACADEQVATRSKALLEYFDGEVFGEASWGTIVRSLRDRVAHRDVLWAGQDGTEEVHGVRLDWPTIQKTTFERLCQSYQNGCFDLLRESSPWLFELPWRSGPYDEEAWTREA